MCGFYVLNTSQFWVSLKWGQNLCSWLPTAVCCKGTSQKSWLVGNCREPAEVWKMSGFRSGKAAAAAAAVFPSLVLLVFDM